MSLDAMMGLILKNLDILVDVKHMTTAVLALTAFMLHANVSQHNMRIEAS